MEKKSRTALPGDDGAVGEGPAALLMALLHGVHDRGDDPGDEAEMMRSEQSNNTGTLTNK